MTARIIGTILTAITFISCGTKATTDGINLIVTDKEDTVSYFHYQNRRLRKYRVYDRHSDLDSIINNRIAQSKLPGEFVFGIKSKDNPMNNFLVFRSVSPTKFVLTEKPQISFLDEEFNIKSEYRVDLIQNYIDSIDYPIRKIETLTAIDKQTKDTILFQDNIYVFRDKELDEVIVSLVIYSNQKAREEMRLLMDDAVGTMKKSTLDPLTKGD